MLNSLRVYELQDFLSAASQARAGRKPELVARAMAAVQRDHRLVARLRQLYEAKRCTTSLTGFRSRPAPYHKVESERTLPTAAPSAAHGQINKRGIMPVDVKFCRLAFYDHIDTIIRASYLRDMSSSLYSRSRSDRSMASVHFQLTPAQSQQIRAGRSVRYGKMNSIQEHYNIQVQLRLCKLETSCQQRDKFPSMCTITVNNNVVPLPSYVYSPVELKKCGVPLDITRFCRLQPYEDNSIRVAWVNNAQQPQQYSMQLTLVKELSSSNLLHQLRTKGIRNADHSRALIKDKLTNSPESEVALTSLRVSLLCPLGKMRMSLPCRGAACNHLQCFDGTLYVQMNEKKSSWICPVCDQALPFESLFIDGLFTEILSANPRSNEIEFLHDGSWKVMQQQSGKTDFSVLTSKFGSPASCNGLEGPDAIIAGLMRKPDSSLSALPPLKRAEGALLLIL
ncbi:E3 SUMO-protein ligase PIAS2-like [Corticium candelabrum]|uniref:E3 SUMO-protein ligase PIAS2-like n=1 Tax=Corticium candelabrum TaxID=121492 RepID=UPI002E261BF3|nr:E3 SUMO-protein ligase PIAS2-like [Corticium candelabrum]